MNNDHLPLILDGLTEAVFLVGPARQILFANRTAVDLFGKGLVGNNFVRAIRHPECIQCIDEVLAGAPKSRVAIQLQRPSPRVYQVSVVGLDPSDPEDVRAVVSIDDISHVHEAEQMRSDFVANVSHELRSPLTALCGFIETLQSSAKDDPVARERFLGVMEQEANRMNRLIGDLLSLSKVESNARIRPTGICDVHTVIQRVIAMLAVQAQGEGKTIELEVKSRTTTVPGEDDELTQVFQNLIENALKYGGPNSSVLVSVQSVQRDPVLRAPALSIAVRDQGPGIPAQHIPRLTERFYRVDDGRSRDKGGTGLGLAIVKHIVGRHRGRLQILSETGVGSVFTVLLPMTLEAS